MVDRYGDGLSQADIARAAGVERPSVNNWKKRHADFPRPVDRSPDRYAIDEMARWLMRRRIPANALRPGEPAGTTYGDRFVESLGLAAPTTGRPENRPGTAPRRAARSAWTPPPDLWQKLEKRQGRDDPNAFQDLVLVLLHLRCYDRERWAVLARTARQAPSRDVERALASALTEHQRRYPDVRETWRGVRLRLWTDWQLAEIVGILDHACAGDDPDVPPTATRAAVVCRFLLDRFATSDGVRGGEFSTPEHLVRLMVRLLAPQPQEHVYDPSCGNGSLLVGAAAHVEESGGASRMPSFSGRALSERSLRLARLNLAIHGLTKAMELRRANVLRGDVHGGRRFDVVFANPPFNMSDWSRGDPADDPRWRYGPPPRRNANFAWLQHIAGKLSPRGRAAVLMPNAAAVSADEQEHRIRAAMVDAGVVDCVVMLPGQLFRSTAVPVTLWLLRNRPPDESDRVLFIDARSLGTKVERAHRVLRDEDIGQIVDVYREWRRLGATYAGIPGFSVTATKADIKARGYALAASRYVTAQPSLDPRAEAKVRRLCDDLKTLHERATAVDAFAELKLSEVLR